MKRVALFPSAFHPSLGGVEELTGQLALQMVKKGGGVLICTNRWPRALPAKEWWKGVLVHRFPFRLPEDNLKARVSFRLTGMRILREVVRALVRFRAEVVHVHCVSANAWYAARAAEALGLPLVVSSHGERTMDANGLYEKSPLYNRILRDVLGRARWVTACSKATLGDLQTYWGRDFPNGQSVVYGGVGEDAFCAASAWQHPVPYIFALGRLVKQKGFSELLKAFALADVPGVNLLLAGEGPERETLTELRDSLGLCGKVHFVGRADRAQVRSLFSGCIGLVVPSLREPMGIVALEGMAAGKPLVVSAVGGLREIVPEGAGARHVAPGDVGQLAEGIVWLANRRETVGATGLGERVADFLWANIAQKYAEIYEKIARRQFEGDSGRIAWGRALTFG